MIRLVCSVLAMQLGLLDSFPFLRSYFHTGTYTHFDMLFEHMVRLRQKVCIFSKTKQQLLTLHHLSHIW
jgi:hypothetical protein